ncbi:MAG TPA: cytochrome c oxidase subunit 3 family protein [Candidatus Limnocylindrales bacterium]|nr:cytochrome c oxidase subunit 3 family protein [Candidatus Limnocylindrales bacterium]
MSDVAIPAVPESRLQSHFANEQQQYETATFGMWVFLVTEIMFFGGLFTAYLFYRIQYADAFVHASHHLDIVLGTFNTVVLIGSSLTMAMAVHSARMSRSKSIAFWIAATMLLGSIFLGVKAYEYTHKWHEGLFPANFFYSAPDAAQQRIYFSLYFAMTGLHATHMVIGMGIMVIIAWQALKGAYTSRWYTPVEIMGLYWHFVDLVWIFLFPLLYLIGRH